jgi:hypothetical protein
VVSISWTSPDSHVWTAGEVLTASNMNTYIRLNLDFLYGDVAWTAPVYANAWVDYGAPYAAMGFRLLGTRVVFRGAMKSGTMSAAAFTLPAGYRPTAQINVVSNSGGFYGAVTIVAAGTVTPNSGSNAQQELNGASFDTI